MVKKYIILTLIGIALFLVSVSPSVFAIPPSPDNPCHKNGNCLKDLDQVSSGPPITKKANPKEFGVSSQISVPSGVTKGIKKIIVIPIEFIDKSHIKSTEWLNSTISEISQYYKENSYNQLNFTIDLANWYMADHTMIYYGANDPNCPNTADSGHYIDSICNSTGKGNIELTLEALKKADNDIDFSKYDIVLVVHAGYSEQESGNGNDLYTISWNHLDYNTNDGVKIDSTVMIDENSELGAYAHEVAHQLGVPDLYWFDNPVGYWDLMDLGCWSGYPQGSNPSHLSSWSKILLGWTSPTYVNPTTSYNLNILPLSSNLDGIKTVEIPINNSPNQYFLVENRQKGIGVYDSSLPETGILIWHIDDNQGYLQFPNSGSIKGVVPEDQNPSLFYPPQGTKLDDAAYMQGDQDFTPFTNPNSSKNSGVSSGIYIGSWTQNGTSYLVTFNNLDVTSPTVIMYSPLNRTYSTKTIKLNVSTNEIVKNIKISLDGLNIAECSNCNSINYDIASSTDGTHTIIVNVTDYADNQNTATVTFSVDASPPTINILSPSNKLYNSSTVLLNVSAYDMIVLTNATWIKSSLDNDPNITECYNCSSFSHNMTSLFNGIHNVSIYAADSYDNENSANVIFNTYVSYPTVTIDNPLNDSIISTKSTILEVSTDENSTCQCYLDTNYYSNFSTRIINNLTQIINNLSEGNHSIDVKCKNNYDAENSTKVLFSVDTTPPTISNAFLFPFVAKANSNITFFSTITDTNGIEYAYITGYNSSWYDVFPTKNLTKIGDDWITTYNVNNLSEGFYYFNVTSADKLGNNFTVWIVNATINETSGAIGVFLNTSFSAIDKIIINAIQSTNTSLEMATIQNISNATIGIASFSENPGSSNYALTALGKYVEIEASPELKNGLSWAIIKIYYNDSDIPSGYNENNLRIYYFNPSGTWSVYDGNLIGGVNTTANYVWANTTHFSVYGVFVNPTCSDGIQNQGETGIDCGGSCSACYSPPSSQPSGGGGGGGGGGGSITVQSTAKKEQCNESWSCSEWSQCTNGKQTRTCNDLNKCNTTTSKPVEEQSCQEQNVTVEKNATVPSNVTARRMPTGFAILTSYLTSPITISVIIIVIVIGIMYWKKLFIFKKKSR